MFTCHADGIFRGATKEHRQTLLIRFDGRKGILCLIEFALMVEAFFRVPAFFQHIDIFIRTLIAARLRFEIAVTALFCIASAADDMHCDAAIQKVIERCELASRQCGGNKTRAVRQQEVNAGSVCSGMGSHQKGVRLIRSVGHQNAVKTRVFVGFGEIGDVLLIKNRTGRRDDFRCQTVADHPDKLHAHELSLLGSEASGGRLRWQELSP